MDAYCGRRWGGRQQQATSISSRKLEKDKVGRGGGISAVGGGKGRRCGTRVATNVRQGSARAQGRGMGSNEPRGSAEKVLARWAAAITGEELGETECGLADGEPSRRKPTAMLHEERKQLL